jgi:hypothetical protein
VIGFRLEHEEHSSHNSTSYGQRLEHPETSPGLPR